MATEVTTQMRQVVSSSVKRQQGQKASTISGVGQNLPVSVQSVPPPKVDGQTTSRQVDQAKMTSSQQVELAKVTSSQQVDQALLDRAVDDLNAFVQDVRRELRFSVDDDSGRTVIKVIDSESQEVVRQIPPEEVVAMTQRLHSRSGLLMQAEV